MCSLVSKSDFSCGADVTPYKNLFQLLPFLWRMNQNKKEITNYWQVIVLKSRHTDLSLVLTHILSRFPTRNTYVEKIRKKGEKVIFPLLMKFTIPPSSTSSESPKHYFRWSYVLHLNYYSSFTTSSSTFFWQLDPKKLIYKYNTLK